MSNKPVPTDKRCVNCDQWNYYKSFCELLGEVKQEDDGEDCKEFTPAI